MFSLLINATLRSLPVSPLCLIVEISEREIQNSWRRRWSRLGPSPGWLVGFEFRDEVPAGKGESLLHIFLHVQRHD